MARKPLTIAITGGTGFLGRYVIKAALKDGHKIRAMARRPEAVADLTHDNLTWIKGGLGQADGEICEGADVVIHLAGLIKAKTRELFYAVNGKASGYLAQAAKNADVKRFVLISSMAAREPDLSHYAGSKRAGERAVQRAFTGKISIIRGPAVFGGGDKATEPFFKLLKKGLLPVPGGSGWKDRKISMVFAPDLAKDIVRAAVTGCYDDQIVSPANMPELSWKAFGQLCEQAFERKIRILPLPKFLLYPVAGITSITSRLFGKGHLTLDKLGEFLHSDWSSETLILGATRPIEALKLTMAAYAAQKDV